MLPRIILLDSVTDALTVNLAQVEGLEAISRTTALQYRQTGKRLSEIGRELPVNGIVSGTVVRSGTGVRITAQLGRVATDRVEWGRAAEAYDAYLKGLRARGPQQHDAFRRAVGYFEQAIAIEPDFAEAYAALALTQLQFVFGGPFFSTRGGSEGRGRSAEGLAASTTRLRRRTTLD